MKGIEGVVSRGATSVQKSAYSDLIRYGNVLPISVPCNGGQPCFPTKSSGNLS